MFLLFYQHLAALLYTAADKEGCLDRTKVERILTVTREEAFAAESPRED